MFKLLRFNPENNKSANNQCNSNDNWAEQNTFNKVDGQNTNNDCREKCNQYTDGEMTRLDVSTKETFNQINNFLSV
ncbi:hypothetical protein D9M71_652950 [compost metagenome]